MADPIVPPAGTPPAAQPTPGGQPIPTPTPAPVTNPEPGKIILSQEQFDKRWADKMSALEKELGIPLKDAKGIIAAKKKADDEAKTELQKLQDALKSKDEELSGTNLKLAKIEALLEAGVPSDKVPKLLKRVSGKTPEEIKADIAEMKADGLIPAAQPPQAAQGAGNPGVPGTPGKKTWKKSEIQKIVKTADAATLEEINKATLDGRVDYNS